MSTARGCFKFGCVGCLLVFGAVLTLGIGVAVISATRDSRIESLEVVRELPVGETPPGFLGADSPASGAELPLGEPGAELPLGEPGAPQPPAGPGGTVDLDLRVGDFEILPVGAGEPIRVVGEFDVEAFVLEEELVEEGDGWTYAITFRPRGGLLGLATTSPDDHHPPRLVIELPVDRPIALRGEVGIGEMDAELGGLWLTEVDLELGTGEHNLRFDAPTREPVELLRLEKSIGAMSLRDVGHASPRRVALSQRIGELDLGLTGTWTTDSAIEIQLGLGEIDVDLPDDVRVVVDRAMVALGDRHVRLPLEEDLPPGAPTLTLRARGRIGELSIR